MADPATTYINSPKQASEPGQKIPGRFKVTKMEMLITDEVSIIPRTIDIREIVTMFSVTAELFSPTLTLSGTIRDTNNKLGGLLTGQEKIILELEAGYDAKQRIKRTFAIKEYPNYIKTLDFPNNRIFTFVAVSSFAYADRLMKICRPVKNDTFKNIEYIFKEDLGVSRVVLEGDNGPKSAFDGIITTQSPLQAAEWLRSRTFDDDQSPFFLYNKVETSTTDEVVYFGSFSGLAKSQPRPPVERRYKYRQLIEADAGTDKAYAEEQTRILNMTSNIKLDRLKTALGGGYSNRLNVTDFASKTFFTLDYTTQESTAYPISNSQQVFPWKSNEYTISDGKNKRFGEILQNIPEVSISNIQINSAPTYGNTLKNSVTESLAQNIQRAKSFIARMNEYDHEIVVYGDTALNPGLVLSLEVPEPQSYNDPDGRKKTFKLDATVSGRHLITIASHNFVDGIYTCKLKLFKIEDLPVTAKDQWSENPIEEVNPEIPPQQPSIPASALPPPTNPAAPSPTNPALPSGNGSISPGSVLPDLGPAPDVLPFIPPEPLG